MLLETTESGQAHFNHDANASLIAQVGSDGTTAFEWDAAGRLASVTVTKAGVSTTNSYD